MIYRKCKLIFKWLATAQMEEFLKNNRYRSERVHTPLKGGIAKQNTGGRRPRSYKTKNVASPSENCTTQQPGRLPPPHTSPCRPKASYKPFISASNSALMSAPKLISWTETRSSTQTSWPRSRGRNVAQARPAWGGMSTWSLQQGKVLSCRAHLVF